MTQLAVVEQHIANGGCLPLPRRGGMLGAREQGEVDGRMNRQWTASNYRQPADWIAWLAGWRAGQAWLRSEVKT